MKYLQLGLFKESQEEKNAREVHELKVHCEKLRKSLYARNNELHKEVKAMKSDLELLISHICKGKL